MDRRIEVDGVPTPIDWQSFPTVYVDGAIGASHANGVQRVIFAQVTHNPDPNAEIPSLKPVLEMVIPHARIGDLISYLSALNVPES